VSVPAWHEEPIGKHHAREAFDCGDSALNEFLHRYARKSHDLGGAKTFLAIEDGSATILGFYSLSAASVAYAQVPELVKRGLARHEVPGFRLARLGCRSPVSSAGSRWATAADGREALSACRGGGGWRSHGNRREE
jgi:hypothetical protein